MPRRSESYASIHRVIHEVQPDECYHLAAQSFVSYSFDDEFSTLNTNINGTHFLLAAVRTLTPHCRFYFAGSSEMFGLAETVPQNENTRFHPRSSYGISKVAGFDLTRNYREAYGMYAASGILFNHESPRRGFRVRDTQDHRRGGRHSGRKKHAAPVGEPGGTTRLGPCPGIRGSHVADAAAAGADDYVVATGECHSVREFVDMAFSHVGLDYTRYVTTDSELYRPAEVNLLQRRRR